MNPNVKTLQFQFQLFSTTKRSFLSSRGRSHQGHDAFGNVSGRRSRLLLPPEVPDVKRRVQQCQEPDVGRDRGRVPPNHGTSVRRRSRDPSNDEHRRKDVARRSDHFF